MIAKRFLSSNWVSLFLRCNCSTESGVYNCRQLFFPVHHLHKNIKYSKGLVVSVALAVSVGRLVALHQCICVWFCRCQHGSVAVKSPSSESSGVSSHQVSSPSLVTLSSRPRCISSMHFGASLSAKIVTYTPSHHTLTNDFELRLVIWLTDCSQIHHCACKTRLPRI